jgi:peptidoglycan hydrolase CwlO-like protein
MDQDSLQAQIASLGEEIRAMKTNADSDQDVVNAKVTELKELKKQLKELSSKKALTLKTPKVFQEVV